MPAPRGPVAFEMDERQLAAFVKRLERWKGTPLHARLQKGTLKAADFMVRPIRAYAPREKGRSGARHRPGWLRSSVRARQAKTRTGSALTPTLGALVGPTAPHSHLVIRGTGPHPLETKRPGRSLFAVIGGARFVATGRLGGVEGIRRTSVLHHPGSRPDPFVDRAAQAHSSQAFRIVSQELFGP